MACLKCVDVVARWKQCIFYDKKVRTIFCSVTFNAEKTLKYLWFIKHFLNSFASNIKSTKPRVQCGEKNSWGHPQNPMSSTVFRTHVNKHNNCVRNISPASFLLVFRVLVFMNHPLKKPIVSSRLTSHKLWKLVVFLFTARYLIMTCFRTLIEDHDHG